MCARWDERRKTASWGQNIASSSGCAVTRRTSDGWSLSVTFHQCAAGAQAHLARIPMLLRLLQPPPLIQRTCRQYIFTSCFSMGDSLKKQIDQDQTLLFPEVSSKRQRKQCTERSQICSHVEIYCEKTSNTRLAGRLNLVEPKRKRTSER